MMSEDSFKVPSALPKTQKPSNEPVKTANESSNTTPESAESERKNACPYKEPKWSQKPPPNLIYRFEVLKSGAIIEKEENLQEKSFWIFGRLPNCDIVMAHPTISRYHAVLQYKGKEQSEEGQEDEQKEAKFGQGWYIYDLGSTHGTFLNKMRIPPKTFIQVKVGHMLKLGASTRNYILQGPEFDQEPESELTVTELKELRIQQEENKRKEEELQEKLREKEGINWGMAEDADEETDLTVNPYASTNNEEIFLDDPKKTLRGFFEREGLELEYNVDEMSAGTFVCRVELPIDDTNGKPLVAEICHKGKKKDCVAQCALEACRILDRHGVLRQSHHEPLKRKAPTKDSDDEDDFLDRTGDIERKKQRKAAGSQNVTLTYEDLLKQEQEILTKMTSVDENILKYQELSKRSKNTLDSQEDDLDTFMTNLSEDSKFDKTEIRKLRVEQQRLKSEHQKLQRLIKIAKPVDLPSITTSASEQTKSKSFLPLFGKRNKTKFHIPRSETKTKYVEKDLKSDEEEIEENDEEEESKPEKQENEKEVSTKIQEEIAEKSKNLSNSTPMEVQDNGPNVDEGSIQSKRIFGPAFIPSNLLQSGTQEEDSEKQENVEDTFVDGQPQHEDQTKEDSAASKKKRTRVRIRGKARENVDIDDTVELEDVEKYSGWVPPENQTGDGITSLNQKFGY